VSSNPTAAPAKLWYGWMFVGNAWKAVLTDTDRLRAEMRLELLADEAKIPEWRLAVTTGLPRWTPHDPNPPRPRKWFDGRA
jgi:hypothetical protein